MSKELLEAAGPSHEPVPRAIRAFVAFAIVTLGFAALAFMFGGGDTASYLFHEAFQAILGFLTWTVQAPAWLLVAIVLGIGVATPYLAPTVEAIVVTGNALEREPQRHWRWPGSFRDHGDLVSWKEGWSRRHAEANKAHVERLGLGGIRLVLPVERNEAGGKITYDTKDVPAFRSQLARRQTELVTERLAVAERQALRGGGYK